MRRSYPLSCDISWCVERKLKSVIKFKDCFRLLQVNSFDNDGMGYMADMHDDGLHPPNSVSSDGGIPGTPSELSSPMSSQ